MSGQARAPGDDRSRVGSAGNVDGNRPLHSNTRPLETVLARLDGVIPNGDSFRAFSPFQENRRSRTLSIKEGDDGRVLMHDFAGREVAEILAAIGLTVSDLFPPKPNDRTSHRGGNVWKPRISLADAWEIASVECWAALALFRAVVDGEEVSVEDYARARDAVARLEKLRAEVSR